MSRLTGVKDTDFMILMQLNDYELGQVCQANKYVNSLCEDPSFWLIKIKKVFNLTGAQCLKLEKFLGLQSHKELYIYLKSIPEKYVKKYDVKDLIPILISYLLEENFIDNVIQYDMKKDIPKWFNKEEVIYELRRRFPLASIKAHFNGDKKKMDISLYLSYDEFYGIRDYNKNQMRYDDFLSQYQKYYI